MIGIQTVALVVLMMLLCVLKHSLVPPNVTIMPKNTSVVLGRNAWFSCQFAGNPPPTLRWYFNQGNKKKLPLSRNSSRFTQTKEQLRVVNITERDQGWFTCVARNIVGLQNFSAYLNVLGKFYIDPVMT